MKPFSNASKKNTIRKHFIERNVHTCYYCGIEETEFINIWGDFYGIKRGHRLEIGRKDNGKGYDIDNCVMACALCNCAKSDVITFDEFKEIGKVVRQLWIKRRSSGKE
ncbi:hypothetical protein ES703_57920 [subsurface metagenome]